MAILIHYSLVDYLPPTAIQPTHLYSLILNPSYPSYTKSSAKATSVLNLSTSSPTHCVSCLPPSAPNLTKFDSLFGKRLLKIRYQLSRVKLLVSLTVLQLLSSCSDASGHSVSPVQGQLFIPPLLVHTSFHPLSSCLLVLSPRGTPHQQALFADRHPCLLALAFGCPGLRASLPLGFLASWHADRHSSPMGALNPHSHFFSFLYFSLLLLDCIDDWIVFVLLGIQKLPSQPISKSNFCFKFNPDAAIHNSNILRDSGFNLHNLYLRVWDNPEVQRHNKDIGRTLRMPQVPCKTCKPARCRSQHCTILAESCQQPAVYHACL